MKPGLAHVALAVADLEAACAQFALLFGVQAGPPLRNEAQGVRLAIIDLGNAKIELISPTDPQSPVGRFLQKHPRGGLHHFCLEVDDVQQAVARIEAAGGSVPAGLGTNVHGAPIAFVHPASACGALIELEPAAGHGQIAATSGK